MAGVSVPGVPADLNSILRTMEHRLQNLETASRLYNSAIREGSLRIQDNNGNPMVTLGKLDDGTYGILIASASGQVVFQQTSAGKTRPRQAITMMVGIQGLVSGITSGMRPGTNSASFVELWRGDFYATGSQITWVAQAYANGGNMSWSISIMQVGGAEITVDSGSTTSNINIGGTFDIPTTCLVPDTGTDVVGRNYILRMYAVKTSGASTVDIAMYAPPICKSPT